MIIFILSIMLAFIVSFTCSLLEACLLSLSHADIAQISEKRPLIAKIWTDFKEKIHRPITVILVVNTLAHTIGATVSGSKFNELFDPKWIGVYSLIFSFAMIVWTEILPKTLGVRYNKKLAVIIARPLKFLVVLLNPLVIMLQLINNPFSKKGEDENKFDPLAEINVLTQFAALNHQISNEQEKIVERSINLSTKQVKDIMVKKDQINFLSTDMKLVDALIKTHIYRHTRYLLVQNNSIDSIIGYVNFKDIVSALHINPKNASLKGISRPILSIKETENLANTMSKLLKGYQHIAVIADAKGNTVGMITLEDVIEAVVGQIGDEYDVLPDYVYNTASNRYVAAGGITLFNLDEATGFGLPVDNKTLNDWILEINGKMPGMEDKIKYKNIKISINKIRRGKISEVILEREENVAKSK